MMRRIVTALGVVLALVSVADARPRTHHHHRGHHHGATHRAVRHQAPQCFLVFCGTTGNAVRQGTTLAREQATGDGRPRDCYGIPWCGCWLRHQFGLTDKRLNAVRNWFNVGQPASKEVGAIAIIKPSHVGIVVGIASNGDPIIKSGNHNHRVATAQYSARRVVAYRKL